jgi:hypothetical protein
MRALLSFCALLSAEALIGQCGFDLAWSQASANFHMADKGRTYSFDEEEAPAGEQPKFIYSRSISAAVYLAHVCWNHFHVDASR